LRKGVYWLPDRRSAFGGAAPQRSNHELGEGRKMLSRMKTFKDATMVMAVAMFVGTAGMMATSTAAYAQDERKPPRSGMASAPGQVCKEHRPGSAEYKRCVAEQAKMNKKAKQTKADSAKKAEKAKKAKIDAAKRETAKKKTEDARKGGVNASQAPAGGAGR
jgi:hypothetical protein